MHLPLSGGMKMKFKISSPSFGHTLCPAAMFCCLTLVCFHHAFAWPVSSAAMGATPGEMSTERSDTVRVAIVPSSFQVDPGDTLLVELVITEAGPSFNAFDAYITYDPAVLTFLQTPNPMDQQGPLMKEACPQSFHLFNVAADSTYLVINYSLLCPGISVSGPGVLYRLRFVCGPEDANARLGIGISGALNTRFFFDGSLVEPLETTGATVRIGEGSSTVPPASGSLLRLKAVPNPFNPRTVFTFELPEPDHVQLAIYNLDGRLVKRLLTGPLDAGYHQMTWNGRSHSGSAMAAGVYLVRLQAGSRTAVQAVSLVK
jgi:FlgD Ig-like domain